MDSDLEAKTVEVVGNAGPFEVRSYVTSTYWYFVVARNTHALCSLVGDASSVIWPTSMS